MNTLKKVLGAALALCLCIAACTAPIGATTPEEPMPSLELDTSKPGWLYAYWQNVDLSPINGVRPSYILVYVLEDDELSRLVPVMSGPFVGMQMPPREYTVAIVPVATIEIFTPPLKMYGKVQAWATASVRPPEKWVETEVEVPIVTWWPPSAESTWSWEASPTAEIAVRRP